MDRTEAIKEIERAMTMLIPAGTLFEVLSMAKATMENERVLDLLTDRPCAVCVNHKNGYCTEWNCPFDFADVKENQNAGHYEYGVIDGKGLCLERGFNSREKAEIICKLRNESRPSKDCRVMRRLVMAWETVVPADKEESE